MIQSELFTQHEESLRGVQKSILEAWVDNQREKTELANEYSKMIRTGVTRRKRLFNSLMLSSLPEDDSVQLTENQCVASIIKSYYHSCNYVYPFDNDLMRVLRLVCRFRKANGVYVLDHSILCGREMIKISKTMDFL